MNAENSSFFGENERTTAMKKNHRLQRANVFINREWERICSRSKLFSFISHNPSNQQRRLDSAQIPPFFICHVEKKIIYVLELT